MGNALAQVPKAQHQNNDAEGLKTWRHLADHLRARLPKLAARMDKAKAGIIAFMALPRAHWPKLHSKNLIERLNKEVKRRADVVGIFYQRGVDHPFRRRRSARTK